MPRKIVTEVQARKELRLDEIEGWFLEYTSLLSCQQCGENDIAALDFHHRDPAAKELLLAQAVHNGWSIQRILQGIKKCDVLCANCHVRLHAFQRG